MKLQCPFGKTHTEKYLLDKSQNCLLIVVRGRLSITNSPEENQNDLELDFKVFFFVDSCCVGIVLDESK